jgi:hypothetical protein
MTDEEFLVLNSVYLRKIATADVAGECTALPPATITAALSEAEITGTLVNVGEGQFMLSEEGTQQVLDEYRSRYADQRGGSAVGTWYERFEVLNGQFLNAISVWQSDEGADTSKLDRLLRLVERQIKSLDSVTAQVQRYGIYRNRFQRALDHVHEGESKYVVSPSVDSIHNIWFEFHEDILTLIGRPRDVAEAHQ